MEHYLDNAATTKPCAEAAAAVMSCISAHYGNPSSLHRKGLEAQHEVEYARNQIAGALGCKAQEIVFTSGATESSNLAIRGAVAAYGRKRKKIVASAVEHASVKATLSYLETLGFTVVTVPPAADGEYHTEDFLREIDSSVCLVSMMLVNNETGCIFPVQEVARLLREKNSRALLHCDAVQGFLKVPCDPVGWGVDLMSLSAHKIGGPKGAGALYTAPALRNLRPLLPGGGQEGGLRSGTEATAQIAGFARAVALRQENLTEKLRHMADIKAYCREKLLSIPGVVPVGQGEAPHILAVSLVGYPSANIVTDLGAKGICISAGSACHRGKASHVVSALHLDKKTAAGVIRVSFGPETTRADIDGLYQALLDHKNQRFPML